MIIVYTRIDSAVVLIYAKTVCVQLIKCIYRLVTSLCFVLLRRGLPPGYLNYMGVSNSDNETPERSVFQKRIQKLMSKLWTYAPVDAACDQMGKRLMHDSLPPYLR